MLKQLVRMPFESSGTVAQSDICAHAARTLFLSRAKRTLFYFLSLVVFRLLSFILSSWCESGKLEGRGEMEEVGEVSIRGGPCQVVASVPPLRKRTVVATPE